jgi:hypothetical protein
MRDLSAIETCGGERFLAFLPSRRVDQAGFAERAVIREVHRFSP